MKRILCAALLMGLTTALHAGAYMWDFDSSSFKNGGETLGAYTNISKLVIIVDCYNNTDSVVGNYFTLTQQGGANLLKLSVLGDAVGATGAEITVKDKSVTSSFDRAPVFNADVGNYLKTVFTFSELNNQGAFQKLDVAFAFTSGADFTRTSVTADVNADFNGLSFDSLTALGGMSIEYAKIEIEGDPVPEPGLLALLALGGAGLVLRRKVRS